MVLSTSAIPRAGPSGLAEVDDLTIEGVASLTAFENLLLKEDGCAPAKIPFGNAWKTLQGRRPRLHLRYSRQVLPLLILVCMCWCKCSVLRHARYL
jgi:hypothetical protein